MLLGAKIKSEFVEKCVAGLSRHLHEDEHVLSLVKTNKLKPMLDLVVVTNDRVLGISSIELPSKGPKVSIRADEIRAVRLEEKRFSNPSVTVETVWDTNVGLGQMIAGKEDGSLLTGAIEALRTARITRMTGAAGRSLEEQASVHPEGATAGSHDGAPLLDEHPDAAPTVNMQSSGSLPAASLADELAKLAALRHSGVLDEDEFAAAKAAAIAARLRAPTS